MHWVLERGILEGNRVNHSLGIKGIGKVKNTIGRFMYSFDSSLSTEGTTGVTITSVNFFYCQAQL